MLLRLLLVWLLETYFLLLMQLVLLVGTAFPSATEALLMLL